MDSRGELAPLHTRRDTDMLHGLGNFRTTGFQQLAIDGVELRVFDLQRHLEGFLHGDGRRPLTKVGIDLSLELFGLSLTDVGINGILLEILDNGLAGQKNAGVLLFIPGHLPPEIPELAMMEKEMGEAKIDLGDQALGQFFV